MRLTANKTCVISNKTSMSKRFLEKPRLIPVIHIPYSDVFSPSIRLLVILNPFRNLYAKKENAERKNREWKKEEKKTPRFKTSPSD